jgi:hypothetical protein
VQLTPDGAATSIQFGVGLTDAPVGSVRGLYLVVSDIEDYRRQLTDRGVSVSEIRHKNTDRGWRGGFLPGLDAGRADYASSPISATRTAIVGCCRNVAALSQSVS